MTTVLNKKANIAPPALAFHNHHEVPILKTRKQMRLWVNIFSEDLPCSEILASTISRGIIPIKIRGVKVPEKGNARNINVPPIKDAIQRFFRFNVISKYNG